MQMIVIKIMDRENSGHLKNGLLWVEQQNIMLDCFACHVTAMSQLRTQ